MISFEEVFTWLNHFNASHVSDSSRILIDKMMKSQAEGRADEVRGMLQQVYDLACNLRDNKEVIEILIECGHISFVLSDFAEAKSILEDCVSRAWGFPHERAITWWLLGCVQWQSLSTRPQAIVSWRNGLNDIKRLATEAGLTYDQHAWYQEIYSKLDLSLLEALEFTGDYVDVDENHPKKKTVEKSSPKTENASEIGKIGDTVENHPSNLSYSRVPSQPQTFDILQLFTVSDEIPAGDFGPSGVDPFPIGTVEIDRLMIDGRPYSIHSLRGSRVVTLSMNTQYHVVKVKGDSMNLAGIAEKDFVLLRRVDSPANGDIVMAEIVGLDSHATLKKYHKENGQITLSPNSSNPVHTPFVFKNISEGFFIRGVVVAVIKPI